ncbi:MAG: ABC transporter substrate-binding protein [Beijerinckiaceae bacterium]
MNRRNVLFGLTSAPLLSLSSAFAQDARPRRVAVLMGLVQSPESERQLAAMRARLAQLGWKEGRNLSLDVFWGASDPKSVDARVAQALAVSPDLIVANGSPATSALRKLDGPTPVVFVVVSDPVGSGYVKSLAAPGGRITGFSTFEPDIGGKWVTLLRDVAPGLKRIGAVLHPGFKEFVAILEAAQREAARAGIEITPLGMTDPQDPVDARIAEFAAKGAGALLVFPTGVNVIARDRIIRAAATARMPACYPFRIYAADGGLMSYGFDHADLFAAGASYVARILAGEKPADLPVQAPTRFSLTLNLRAAERIGLTFPTTLLAQADELIE